MSALTKDTARRLRAAEVRLARIDDDPGDRPVENLLAEAGLDVEETFEAVEARCTGMYGRLTGQLRAPGKEIDIVATPAQVMPLMGALWMDGLLLGLLAAARPDDPSTTIGYIDLGKAMQRADAESEEHQSPEPVLRPHGFDARTLITRLGARVRPDIRQQLSEVFPPGLDGLFAFDGFAVALMVLDARRRGEISGVRSPRG